MKSTFPFYLLAVVWLAACGQPDPKSQKPAAGGTTTADPVVEALQADIALHPDSLRLYDVLIDTLTNRGTPLAAVPWCDSLLKRPAPELVLYQLVKADLLRAGKQYPEAIESYRSYLQAKPGDNLVYLSLANTMAEAGDSSTVDFCQLVEERFPTPEMISGLAFIRGVYYNSKQQYPQARHWLDQCLKRDYTFAEAYMEKGYAWYDEGNKAEAKKVFARLTEVNGRYADGWYWLAKCAEETNDTEQARYAYDKALSLNPNITEARVGLTRLDKKQP